MTEVRTGFFIVFCLLLVTFALGVISEIDKESKVFDALHTCEGKKLTVKDCMFLFGWEK